MSGRKLGEQRRRKKHGHSRFVKALNSPMVDDMTPEMVMASIQRTVDKSDRVPEFFDLDSMEVDGQNLIFHLNRANANMAGSLADAIYS